MVHPAHLGIAKELQRRFLETDRHHRLGGRHALAGAQIERHPAPAPVVDVELERRVGLGHTARRDLVLFQITPHGPLPDPSSGVLTPHRVSMHRARRDRPDRAQHLDLLVAQRLGGHGGWRFHGHQGEQLQEMALDHVAHGPGTVVVIRTAPDTQRFGLGDLDVVDVVTVPQRFEQ
jgi:hypothetical protein